MCASPVPVRHVRMRMRRRVSVRRIAATEETKEAVDAYHVNAKVQWHIVGALPRGRNGADGACPPRAM